MTLQCKFCEQPIYITEPMRGYKGSLVYMRPKYLHIAEDKMECVGDQINKHNPHYETPVCHICKTDTNEHGQYCSASGFPRHFARPIGE